MSVYIDPYVKKIPPEKVHVSVHTSDLDGVTVVQIDTEVPGRVRINLNDADVWDGDPERDEQPGNYHSSKEKW